MNKRQYWLIYLLLLLPQRIFLSFRKFVSDYQCYMNFCENA